MTGARGAVLDTCVIIDLERVDLGAFAEAGPSVSAVTVAQLAYGLQTPDPVERYARTERYFAVLKHIEVLAFGLAAAKLYGTMAALVRQAGRNPRPRRMDLQIAATAAANQLPLLTRNPADFQDLGRLVDVVAV